MYCLSNWKDYAVQLVVHDDSVPMTAIVRPDAQIMERAHLGIRMSRRQTVATKLMINCNFIPKLQT